MANLNFAANLLPTVTSPSNTSTDSVGSAGKRWKHGYFETLHADTYEGIGAPIRLYMQPIPPATSGSNTVTWSDSRITENHELIRWNFLSNGTPQPENGIPVDLSWSTSTGTLIVTNNGGTTSLSIAPTLIQIGYYVQAPT